MNFDEAIQKLKAGETVEHGGRTLKLFGRALYDVTDSGAQPKRVPIRGLTSDAWEKLGAS